MFFTLFLSEDFSFSDFASGAIYGSWGALVTVYGLLNGFLVDNMGVAASIKVGFLLSLLARIAIFWTSSRPILLSIGCPSHGKLFGYTCLDYWYS